MPRLRSIRPLLAVAVLATAGATLAACDATSPLDATQEVKTDTVYLSSLNTGDPAADVGLHVYLLRGVRLTNSFSFDLAFDIDDAGVVTVFTVSKVAGPLGTSRAVAMQKIEGVHFNNVTEAPARGYRPDTSFVLPVGTVLGLAITDPTVCPTYFNGYTYYAKLAIDVVDTAAKTVKVVLTVDPNCGYRSFLPGIPEK